MQSNPRNKEVSGSYLWHFRVQSEAHLDGWLRDYFGELKISHEEDGTSILTGKLLDMSAVYGLIIKLRDAGIFIISLQVKRLYREEGM